jgi:hypothetical protein
LLCLGVLLIATPALGFPADNSTIWAPLIIALPGVENENAPESTHESPCHSRVTKDA